MKLNIIIKGLRISTETDSDLTNIAERTGLKKTDLIRHLLKRGINQLKSDSIKAGGFENLELTLRK